MYATPQKAITQREQNNNKQPNNLQKNKDLNSSKNIMHNNPDKKKDASCKFFFDMITKVNCKKTRPAGLGQ